MAKSVESRILELLSSLGPAPGYADVQRVGKKLLAACDSVTGERSNKQVRILLASSFTIDPVAPALAIECSQAGLYPAIKVDGFNTFRPRILDANSSLYKFRPDIVFLAAELGSITPLLSRADQNQAKVVQDASAWLRELIETFKHNSQALLVIHNFATPIGFPFSLSRDPERATYSAINEWLEDTFADDSQVYVLDFDQLSSFHGKNRARDPKLHYLGSMEISQSFLPLIAKAYMAYVQAAKGLSRKCLVLDLDNTLWGGLVAEDGLEGIHLARHGAGSEYYDFQKAILALYNRGVVLAANSKNNLADAQRVFREHPDMLLREHRFASLKINWQDKASNLRSIAKELNLGLDSLVFVDDNPVERAWVRESVPEVMVVDLPTDPSLYAGTLEQLAVFEVLTLTDEDRKRGELYKSERARRQSYQESQGLEDFLKALNTVLTLSLAKPSDFSRVGQLTRKTNQFNMSSRRYSDTEIGQLARSTGALVYTLRVRDAFGDSGLVGVLILKGSTADWKIDTFLLSCRVLGRRIEQAFMTEILCDAKQRGIRQLEGEFIPSTKNAPASDFYRSYGFMKISEDEGRSVWRLETNGWNATTDGWFSVKWVTRDLEARADEHRETVAASVRDCDGGFQPH